MNNFVILSVGAYSDYSPDYYVGDEQITQEKMDFKAREIGDKLIKEYNELPTREIKNREPWDYRKNEKFNPETNKTVYEPSQYDFIKVFEEWLLEKGYKKLENIPEVNVYYDLPHN